MSVVKILCCLLLTYHFSEGKKIKGNRAVDSERSTVLKVMEPFVSSSFFGLFLEGEDTCTLDPLQLHTLTSCGFNSSNPLIIITHGWSVRSTPALLTLRRPEPLHTKHGAHCVEVISCTSAPLQTEVGALRLGAYTKNSSVGLVSMTEVVITLFCLHLLCSYLSSEVYHYQFRIQFVNQMERMEPSLRLFITGTQEESGNLRISFNEKISGNKTYTFLITLDRDLGDLMLLRLHWERPALWKNVWSRMQTIMPWGGREGKPLLTVKKISIKSGETQKR
nr:PREDICTED: uncharacterized protein LOC109645381 [Paralichthys olivaceus]